MSIYGCIELATPSGLLAGWVREDESLDAEIELSVHLDGVLLAYARPTSDRPDTGVRSGYHIEVGIPIRLIDLLSGRLQLQARSSLSVGFSVLAPMERVAETAVEDFVANDLAAFRPEDRDRLFGEIGREIANPDDTVIAARASEQRQRRQLAELVGSLPVVRPDDDAPSMLGLPVGHISPDGSAMIGHDGTLFLVGGSNGLLGLYLQSEEDDTLRIATEQWVTLLERRRQALEERSVQYLQIVVPEKLGVARANFPRAIPAESPMLRRLESEIKSRDLLARHYLSVREMLRIAEPALTDLAFPRTDSHLSFAGNFSVFAAMLARMGLPTPTPPADLVTSAFTGDLAERFFGVKLFDQITLPKPDLDADLSKGLELVEAFTPEGRHVGTRYVWRNASAPFPKKVVAFANSFFERGGDARCLSWWFARSFREFHFVWHPNVDLDYVDREQPDWVIAQTIERFLPIHPQF